MTGKLEPTTNARVKTVIILEVVAAAGGVSANKVNAFAGWCVKENPHLTRHLMDQY